MSTIPEADYKLENNKMLVSLTLKVPVQFEIELQGMVNSDSQDNSTSDDSIKREQEQIKNIIQSSEELIINSINNSQINEQLESLSNQLVTHLLRDKSQHFVSSSNDVRLQTNPFPNPEQNLAGLLRNHDFQPYCNHQEKQDNYQPVRYTHQEVAQDKKRKVRFADSLNDGLTLVVNCVGTALFLGKLANHSWE
ncbi:hypothetical protein [Calothrix sp. 336/3]|uniref:hypothetical protein n=1 Tax=Calothrix sp. 336/3 TaxID=1337936 RepID=UPI0004E46326|nr:hypothetical protein [Calothrix sp. 336/3]AKG20027.1 hypothetical protein IJ00_00735 [Calothrix sp. 336/3]